MINAEIDINAEDNYEMTPFHRSAEHGTSKVAELLIEAKANLNAKNMYGDTPLKLAKKSGNEKMFENILPKYAKKIRNDYIEDDEDVLLDAVYEGIST